MVIHKCVLAGVLSCTLAAGLAAAGTIVEVTGNHDGVGRGLFPSQGLGVVLTTGKAYANVQISALLIGSPQGTAYLTTTVGAGTTVSDEIASAAYSGGGYKLLLTIPVLQPDTYYLTLDVTNFNPPQGWDEIDSGAVIIADTGASHSGSLVTHDMSGYTPARDYSGSSLLIYKVTGDTVVPEPATWMSAALVVLLPLLRGRSRRAQSEFRQPRVQ